jgi:hypothetical protein
MKQTILRVAGLLVLFGALSVSTAHADSRFSVHVGIGAPPVVVTPGPYGYGYYGPAPYPGYVWQPGYYVGTRWIGGGWVPRARFVERRWDRNDYRRYERDRRDWERSRRNWDHGRRNGSHDRRRW